LEYKLIPPGKTVFARGERPDAIYFLNQGSIYVRDYFDEKAAMAIPKYSFFGDYQVLFDVRSHATYYAGDEDTILFSLDRDVFIKLLEEYSDKNR
jgi:CRP-like cAMP-binding protein